MMNVQAKVISVEDPATVKQWIKQDLTIGDAAGSIKLVAWEESVGKLKEGVSYSFIKVTVKFFFQTRCSFL